MKLSKLSPDTMSSHKRDYVPLAVHDPAKPTHVSPISYELFWRRAPMICLTELFLGPLVLILWMALARHDISCGLNARSAGSCFGGMLAWDSTIVSTQRLATCIHTSIPRRALAVDINAATLLACIMNKSQPIHRPLHSEQLVRAKPNSQTCNTSDLKSIKPPPPIPQITPLIKLHPLPPQQLQLRTLILSTWSLLPIAHETSHKTVGRDAAVAGLCGASAGPI